MLELVRDGQAGMDVIEPGSGDPLLRRIRSEFHEMPGLCLTVSQAARLWNMDVHTAAKALHLLVEHNFLLRTDDGRFMAAQ